jgi:hypothetical protein
MKNKVILALCFVLMASIAIGQSAYAESSQLSTTVNLRYLNVQLTYPSEVLPGQAATLSVQATAKDYLRLVNLALLVYYTDGNNLRLLANATVAADVYLSKSNQVSKAIQVNVPADAPRTSLVALVSENIKMRYSYNYWPYYYPYSYWDSEFSNISNAFFVYVYPAYNYISLTDDGLSPLSYIKATTPEYVTLQNEYQTLQQQVAQSQADNRKLQNTISQNNSVIADLNQQLASAQTMIRTLEGFSIILAGLTIFQAFLFFKGRMERRKKGSGDKE